MPRCAGCKNTIEGRYIQAMGRDWHPGCFICDECGKRLAGEFHKHKSQKLCPDCYARTYALRCASCGKPVLGQYITAMGGAWHPECFGCSVCGKSLSGEKFHEHLNKPVCRSCYDKKYAPHCDVCGRSLKGEYKVDLWGNKYCPWHEKEPGPCDFCGRIIGKKTSEGGGRRPDGVEACGICAKTAIAQLGVVESMTGMVRQFFEKRGLGVEAPLAVTLARRTDMPRDNLAEDRLGVISKKAKTRGGEIVEREVEMIYLLENMPAEKLCEVYAHEYGHAWLFLHGYPDLPPQAEEGVAQLFAHLWLAERGTTMSAMLKQMMEKNEDRIYGDGFRKAFKAMNRLGLMGLLDYVKRNRRLP